MKMRFSSLIVVLFLLLTASRDCGAVVVLNEIMFDPDGDESADEFVELFNISTLPVNLSGWTLSDDDGTDSLVDAGQGLMLGPRQYALIMDRDYIEQGSVTYDGIVPPEALIVTLHTNTIGDRGLSNSSGELVTIYNASGNIIDEYRYRPGNIEGHSEERIRSTNPSDSTNWRDSSVLHGTPGFRNSVTPPDRDLAVMSSATDPQFPAESSDFAFTVLVINSGTNPLGGLLRLSGDANADGQFTFLDSAAVPELEAGDSVAVQFNLRMPESGVFILNSVLRGGDDDQSNDSLTSLITSEESTSAIRINEIMYMPLAGHAEWVELVVTGERPVSTQGLLISDGQGVQDSTRRYSLPSLLLRPDEFLLVGADSLLLSESYPSATRVAILNDAQLTFNNGGDSLTLYDLHGEIVERLDYRPQWGGNAAGISLERVSFTANGNDGSNWGSSIASGGSTPGAVNSRSLPTPEHGTSLSAVPSPFTPNGDGTNDVCALNYRTEGPGEQVTLRVFDIRGRIVRTLGGETDAQGQGTVIWDGCDDDGVIARTARYIILLATKAGDGMTSRAKTTVILARPR